LGIPQTEQSRRPCRELLVSTPGLGDSEDLFHWHRMGLATFEPYDGIEFNGIDDKDASVFPVAVPDPSGQPALAVLHRPLFPGTRPEEEARHPAREVDLAAAWRSRRSAGGKGIT
jgi:hypothetical protein